MRTPLSPETLLALWEAGRPQHELDRALTLLAAADPELNWDMLADLPIGERDARLLRLRAASLGSHASGFAECPGCGQAVEFSFDTTPLAREPAVPQTCEATVDGRRLRFRLPTSRDLAVAAAAPDATEGLRRVVIRCLFRRRAARAALTRTNCPPPSSRRSAR